MNYWLMKSEPSTFSIDDLINKPNQTFHWDGVRNYQARNMMRDDMKIGDKIFFYHSNCKPPGVVGIARVCKTSYPDHTAFDPHSPYFDPKSNTANPRWFMVDVKFERKFKTIISLEDIKAQPKLAQFKLVQKGNRLSILPVSQDEWDHIISLEKK